MSKITIVIYYWITVMGALLFVKFAGFADNNAAFIKVLIVVTILYVGVMVVIFTRGKARFNDHSNATQKQYNNASLKPRGNKKKKK